MTHIDRVKGFLYCEVVEGQFDHVGLVNPQGVYTRQIVVVGVGEPWGLDDP